MTLFLDPDAMCCQRLLKLKYIMTFTLHFFKNSNLFVLVLMVISHTHENQELRSWSHVHEKKSSAVGAVTFLRRLCRPDSNPYLKLE